MNITDWLKAISINTWNRLDFVFKLSKSKCSETTLTENLLFEFYTLGSNFQGSVQFFVSNDERISGSDLELFVELKKGFVCFPIQAKRLYPSGNYEKLNYMSNGVLQISKLLDYSEKMKGVPLYLLYNYPYNESVYEILNNSIPNHYPTESNSGADIFDGYEYEIFGCTIANGSRVLQEFFGTTPNTKSFINFHNGLAIPLYLIGELARAKIDFDYFQSLLGYKNEVKYYDRDEVENYKSWTNFTPMPGIGDISRSIKISEFKHDFDFESFEPKFRIVLYSNEELERPNIFFLN